MPSFGFYRGSGLSVPSWASTATDWSAGPLAGYSSGWTGTASCITRALVNGNTFRMYYDGVSLYELYAGGLVLGYSSLSDAISAANSIALGLGGWL